MAEEQQTRQLEAYPRDFRDQLAIRELDDNEKLLEAIEDLPEGNMDLRIALEQCEKAIKKFFSIYLENAIDIMKVCVMLFLRSMIMLLHERCINTSDHYRHSVRVLRLWRKINIRYNFAVARRNDGTTYVKLAAQLYIEHDTPVASRYIHALGNIRFLRKLDEYCSVEIVITTGMDEGDAGGFCPRVHYGHYFPVATGYMRELENLHLLKQHNRRLYVEVIWSNVVIIDWRKTARLLRSCYSFKAHNSRAVAVVQSCRQLHDICYANFVCANATPRNWGESGLHGVRCDLKAACYFRALNTLRVLRQLHHRYISELTWANAMMMNWQEASLLLQGHCTLAATYYCQAMATLRSLRQLCQRCHTEIMWANAMVTDWRQVALQLRCAVTMAYHRRAVAILRLWRQVHHRCYTALTSANGMMIKWRETVSFACELVMGNSWSCSVFFYSRGSLLLQLGDDASAEENQQAPKFLQSALVCYQRAAGNGPVSKWLDCRCSNLETQEGHLCICSLLSPLHWVPRNAHSLLRQIEIIKQRIDHEDYEGPPDQEDDTRALLAYLRGTCLAALGAPNRAIQELEIMLSLKDKMDQDPFLIPHAMIELVKCYKALGDNECAQNMLQSAWKRFFDNSLKSRLLSNIQSKIEMIPNAAAVNGSRQSPPILPGPSYSRRRSI